MAVTDTQRDRIIMGLHFLPKADETTSETSFLLTSNCALENPQFDSPADELGRHVPESSIKGRA